VSESLLTLREAIEQQIPAVRNHKWTAPFDQLRLDHAGEHTGPWAHFYSPNQLPEGDPVDFVIFSMEAFVKNHRIWLPYNGPAPQSPEYKAEATRVRELQEVEA